jgi:hypothetical protein
MRVCHKNAWMMNYVRRVPEIMQLKMFYTVFLAVSSIKDSFPKM